MSEKMVKVCSVCRKASCVHGIFVCDSYKTADIIELPISLLRSLWYENECYWDEAYWEKYGGSSLSRVQPKHREYTEHEKSTQRLARHIADAIYAKLVSLKSDEPIWQHDPHEFLPANVCCDYAGKMRLMKSMVYEIQKILDLETYELVMPKTKEELDKCLRK